MKVNKNMITKHNQIRFTSNQFGWRNCLISFCFRPRTTVCLCGSGCVTFGIYTSSTYISEYISYEKPYRKTYGNTEYTLLICRPYSFLSVVVALGVEFGIYGNIESILKKKTPAAREKERCEGDTEKERYEGVESGGG